MIYFSVYKWRNHESPAPPPPFNVSRLQKSEAEQRADLCSRLQAFGKRNESKTKIRGKRGFKFRTEQRAGLSSRPQAFGNQNESKPKHTENEASKFQEAEQRADLSSRPQTLGKRNESKPETRG